MGGMGGGAERFAAAGLAAAMPALAAGVAASLAPPVAATALFALTAANLWVDRGAPARPTRAAGLALLALLTAALWTGANGVTGAFAAALLLWRIGAETHAGASLARRLGAADGPKPGLGFPVSAAVAVAWLAGRGPEQVAGLALPALDAPLLLTGAAGAVYAAQIAVIAARRWTARRLGESLSPRALFADAWIVVTPPLLALPADPAGGLAALAGWRLALHLAARPAPAPARAFA